MMKFLSITLSWTLVSYLLTANYLYAQNVPKRQISLEWEEVEEVKAYEVEVTRILSNGEKKKPITFSVKKSTWSSKIAPGKYEMRLRSIDYRGVAGDWSEPSLFWVKLPAPNLISPKPSAEFKTEETDKSKVLFKWTAVAGAGGYRLNIKQKNSENVQTFDTQDTQLEVELEVAKDYEWDVVTLMPEDKEPGETSRELAGLRVLGKKLDPPNIDQPQSKFVTELSWKPSVKADSYSYAILRLNAKNKWEVLEKKESTTEIKIPLSSKYPGGAYKFQVKAHGQYRPSSDSSEAKFNVYDGSRTPAAIEEAKLREAIEKEQNSYLVASYLLTILDYQGLNKEAPLPVNIDAVGGTGRVGYGYFPQKSQFGFLAIGDLSGVIIDNKNALYGSLELNGIYRSYLAGTTQYRLFAGAFAKQTPEAKPINATTSKIQNVSHAGPTAGFQIWHPITYKFGIQVNGQGYYSMYAIETPNKEGINPTLSYQAGLLGSYKLRDTMTGFIGYAYRVDKVSYKAKSRQKDPTSFASEGANNEVTMTGHYINLYLEWGF